MHWPLKRKEVVVSKRTTLNVSNNCLPVQVRPQPLEQHFCFPGHLLSPVQFISQGPSPATNGQVPVLTTKINKSRLINLTAFLTPFSLHHTICNISNPWQLLGLSLYHQIKKVKMPLPLPTFHYLTQCNRNIFQHLGRFCAVLQAFPSVIC